MPEEIKKSEENIIYKYIAVLDNPRLALLPDCYWRLLVQLHILGERNGSRIWTPNAHYLAWRLRKQEPELLGILKGLERAGLVLRDKDGGTFFMESRIFGSQDNQPQDLEEPPDSPEAPESA